MYCHMKYKTIKISEELHGKIKSFCDRENLKMNKWCEEQLKDDLLVVARDINWEKSPKGNGTDKAI